MADPLFLRIQGQTPAIHGDILYFNRQAMHPLLLRLATLDGEGG